MRIVNFSLAVMFLVFAFVQVNDPDPVIWILVYGGMAVLSVLAIFEFYPRRLLIGLAAALAGFSVLYWKSAAAWLTSENKSEILDNLAKMEKPYIEESREFLGLLICIFVLIFYVVRSYPKSGHARG